MDNKELLFVIPGAINTLHGVYNTDSRLDQTIDTLNSVATKIGATIVLLDGGARDITKEQWNKLTPLSNSIYSYSNKHAIKTAHASITNSSILKNYCELFMLCKFFDHVSKEKHVQQYSRVFKLSSRYLLSDRFDVDKHLAGVGKISLLGPFHSAFQASVTGNVNKQYMSRLWSFDFSLIDYVAGAYNKMFADFQIRVLAGGYIDTEHLLYKYLNSELVESLEPVGVCGNIALNGMKVDE
jgi:hypothetical protein